ncbi:hypothetical protein [uncultured Megasphaera sp.]|uniref:hypothetical protein n=1 Tax=uncultured Megasphaera sp. TaxID=165188 RepID=UPI00261FAF63|nr:hypothetical protein [uncultured Megasphaera sp.]
MVFANLIEECYQSGVPWQASHKLGELLDLFFARLLPSGTGDSDAGPSQLREKQTNPIMLYTLSFDGEFFLFQLAHGELLDLFFARLLPIGTGDFDAGPSRLREKQTNPIGANVHCGTSITDIIIGHFCFVVNKIMHIKPNGFLLSRP